MKKKIIIIILTLVSSCIFAQEKSYIINGKIEGDSNKVKYAFLYELGGKLLGKCSISNNTFKFSGEYLPLNSWGAIPVATVYLVHDSTPREYQQIKSSNIFAREIILVPSLNIVINLSKGSSTVEGGELNAVHNVFMNNLEFYARKRDTAYLSIDKENLDASDKIEKKRDVKHELYFEQKIKDLEIVKMYPSSKATLANFVVFSVVPMFRDNRVRNTFNMLSDSLKTSKYGITVERYLTEIEQSNTKPDLMGKKMPEFALEDTNHKILKSKELLGKYTLIDFWASWCAPCRAENPNIKAAFENYHNKGLNVISISIDQVKDRAKWIDAIKNDKTQEFTHLFNSIGTPGIAKDLNINAIPANYLLNQEGEVIATDLRGEALSKKMAELFK